MAKRIRSVLLLTLSPAVFAGFIAPAFALQGAQPPPAALAPPRPPDVRRVVDLEKSGEPVFLDAERPVAIDVRAFVPNGRYRSRVIFAGRGQGWMIHPGFTLNVTAAFGEACVSRFQALKAAFEAASVDEALRLLEEFKAGVARSACGNSMESTMEYASQMMTRQVAYGLEPPNPLDPAANAPMKLQIERIDEAGNVLKAYEWPILTAPAQRVMTETDWIVTEVTKRMKALAGHEANAAIGTRPGVWNPGTYLGLARALGVRPRTSAPRVFSNDMLEALTTPTIHTLLAVNHELALALRSDRLNPVTHESSALLIVTVALRSSVAGLEDIRPLLNRATAHLALAQAASPRLGVEGEIALAAIDALTDRQVAASLRLARLKGRLGSSGAGAWHRALMMRATGDWRIHTPGGQANLLEQMEHARALARSWSPRRAANFRREYGAHRESPVWGRVILTSMPVELGNELAADYLGAEFNEASLLATHFGAPDLPSWLQAMPADAGLEPVSELTWARLAEGSFVNAAERYHRYLESLAPSSAPAAFRNRIAAEFPQSLVAQALVHGWRTRVPAPDLPDRCEEVAQWIKTDPFRLSASAWALAYQGCGRLGRVFPSLESRFTPWTVPGTLFDFRNRMEIMGLMPEVMKADWAANRRLTFYEPTVLGFAVGQAAQRDPVAADYQSFRRERAYSVALLRDWRFVTSSRGDVRESLEPGRAACRVDYEECLKLIDVLRAQGHAEEAYATAMRVFGPGRAISVAASNSAVWIIDENVRRGKVALARDIAERAARTGSYVGLLVQARLVERMGDQETAGRLYSELDQADGGDASRTFAIRQMAREGGGRDAIAAAVAALGTPFLLTTSTGEEVPGLLLGYDWLESIATVRRAEINAMGLEAFSLITAVNGFTITNESQFWAVLSLDDNPEIELTVRSNERPEPRVVRGRFSRANYGPIAATK